MFIWESVPIGIIDAFRMSIKYKVSSSARYNLEMF